MSRYLWRLLFLIVFFMPLALILGTRASAVHTTSTGCSHANTGVFSFSGGWIGTITPPPPTNFSLTLPPLDYTAGEVLSTTAAFSGAITNVTLSYELPPGTTIVGSSSGTSPSAISYTFPADTSGELKINLDFTTTSSYFFSVSTTCTPVPDPPTPVPPTPVAPTPIVPTPTVSPADCTNDGRVNSVCAEPWQTAAIYCQPEGVIDVYAIRDGAGTLVIRATPEEIDAVGVPADGADASEMLIEQSADEQVRLYRLPDGSFQVNAPINDAIRGILLNGYVYTWQGCE